MFRQILLQQMMKARICTVVAAGLCMAGTRSLSGVIEAHSATSHASCKGLYRSRGTGDAAQLAISWACHIGTAAIDDSASRREASYTKMFA